MFEIIQKVVQGPQYDPLKKNKLYVSNKFNVNSRNFNYIRQSKAKDLSSKKWQLSSMPECNETNLIVNDNSAFQEKTAYHIYNIIVYISSQGNKKFTITVTHHSRFSRNLKVTEKILLYLIDNNVTLYLNIGGTLYNYINDYAEKLRPLFKEGQNYSLELSRTSTLIALKKKQFRDKIRSSEMATNYFKWFITNKEFLNQTLFNLLNRVKFSPPRMNNYFYETQNKFVPNKKLYYFYCVSTGLMIVCPREIACIENLDYTIIKGFSKQDLIAIANSGNKFLSYICYYHPESKIQMDIDN